MEAAMIKAVFIDYTGTTVMEGGTEMETAAKRICKNSVLHDPKKMMSIWWSTLKRHEAASYGEAYLTCDEILWKTLNEFKDKYSLNDDLDELQELVSNCWATAPVFADVNDFYDKCPLPLFVITNNSISCVSQAMRKNNLHPTGIISADSVKAYKPHKELFEKALEIADCKPQEAVHIGDSYTSDVLGARTVGILPILLQRTGDQKYEDDLIVVKSLKEVLQYLN